MYRRKRARFLRAPLRAFSPARRRCTGAPRADSQQAATLLLLLLPLLLLLLLLLLLPLLLMSGPVHRTEQRSGTRGKGAHV